jgi:hypothetical protein
MKNNLPRINSLWRHKKLNNMVFIVCRNIEDPFGEREVLIAHADDPRPKPCGSIPLVSFMECYERIRE